MSKSSNFSSLAIVAFQKIYVQFSFETCLFLAADLTCIPSTTNIDIIFITELLIVFERSRDKILFFRSWSPGLGGTGHQAKEIQV